MWKDVGAESRTDDGNAVWDPPRFGMHIPAPFGCSSTGAAGRMIPRRLWVEIRRMVQALFEEEGIEHIDISRLTILSRKIR